MSLIAISAAERQALYKKNLYCNLVIERTICEFHFDWIHWFTYPTYLKGEGVLRPSDLDYHISILYSPDFGDRFDRITITKPVIPYHPQIHMYPGGALCLYHPMTDRPSFRILPLYHIIPWITEWCIHYEQWKKYGIWLGREYLH